MCKGQGGWVTGPVRELHPTQVGGEAIRGGFLKEESSEQNGRLAKQRELRTSWVEGIGCMEVMVFSTEEISLP